MSAYGPLAAWYDVLTRDVDYADFADYYEMHFRAAAGPIHTLLDLCCGTGTLTCLMAERGYEMIAADASADMLMQAQEKTFSLPEGCVPPLLLCQPAEELDLYGTVDAAYCSLDGETFVDETEDVLCLWRAELDDGVMRFGMDLFERDGEMWTRESEEHIEYVHTPEQLTKLLTAGGFTNVRTHPDGPQGDRGRLFFTAIREE